MIFSISNKYRVCDQRGAGMIDYIAMVATGLTILLCAVAGVPGSPGLQDHNKQVFVTAAYALGGSTESTKACPSGVSKDGGTCGTTERRGLPDK